MQNRTVHKVPKYTHSRKTASATIHPTACREQVINFPFHVFISRPNSGLSRGKTTAQSFIVPSRQQRDTVLFLWGSKEFSRIEIENQTNANFSPDWVDDFPIYSNKHVLKMHRNFFHLPQLQSGQTFPHYWAFESKIIFFVMGVNSPSWVVVAMVISTGWRVSLKVGSNEGVYSIAFVPQRTRKFSKVITRIID